MATIGGGLALALTSSVVLASPSLAATGNPTLGRHLIHDPIANGMALPSSVLTSYYTSFVQQENASIQGSGISEAVAVTGWRAKHSTTQLMIVTLIAISAAGKSTSDLNALAVQTAASAGKNVCNGASKSGPALDVPIPRLPNSSYVRCQTSTSGTVVVATATVRANVVAVLVTSSATLSRSALTTATRQQYGLLSKKGFH
jgi:hypothetical protein